MRQRLGDQCHHCQQIFRRRSSRRSSNNRRRFFHDTFRRCRLLHNRRLRHRRLLGQLLRLFRNCGFHHDSIRSCRLLLHRSLFSTHFRQRASGLRHEGVQRRVLFNLGYSRQTLVMQLRPAAASQVVPLRRPMLGIAPPTHGEATNGANYPMSNRHDLRRGGRPETPLTQRLRQQAQVCICSTMILDNMNGCTVWNALGPSQDCCALSSAPPSRFNKMGSHHTTLRGGVTRPGLKNKQTIYTSQSH